MGKKKGKGGKKKGGDENPGDWYDPLEVISNIFFLTLYS
jgi:hypothetical protein